MADKLQGVTGLGDNDPGALTPEQQSKLNDFKVQTRLDNELYLRNHPETSQVLQMFVKEVLTKKPDNIRTFAAEYFSDNQLPDKVKQQLLANYVQSVVHKASVKASSS